MLRISHKILLPFIMNRTTQATFEGLVVIALIIFDSVRTLLSIREKGIFKDRRKILLKKTNKELKEMLSGMKKISNLKKEQLVELVIQYA